MLLRGMLQKLTPSDWHNSEDITMLEKTEYLISKHIMTCQTGSRLYLLEGLQLREEAGSAGACGGCTGCTCGAGCKGGAGCANVAGGPGSS